MAKTDLAGIRVAILAADGFEQVELTSPRKKLEDHGASADVISLRPGSIRGVNYILPGSKVKVDRTIFTAKPDNYDALFIPGGLVGPDTLRQSDRVLRFVEEFDDSGKPIAMICHGPWIMISADLVHGRRLTSWPGIRDDVENAGGLWTNMSVVRDGNWISSRGPQDIVQFNKAIVEHFDPRKTARERRFAMPPIGQMVAGGVALAALGFGATRLSQTGDEYAEEYSHQR